MTVFSNWSLAVTETLKVEPAEAELGAVITKWVAPEAANVTVREADTVIAVTVSVAVMVCEPAVVKITLKYPTPSVRVESAGRVPAEVEVK